MGDADVVGAVGGTSSLESGDACGLAASRAMEGGSLPPRKRLLAGLKQNGWLSGSPPPAEESPTAGAGYGSGQAGGASVAGVVRSGSGKYEEGVCTGCNAVESNGVRRIKRGGVSLRLCSACTVLYSKSMFCPHCLAMYHDASLLGDPSMWLVCTRCRRSVHPECEQKHSGSTPDAGSYVCLDCVNSARRQREVNGVTGMRSKHREGRPVPSFHGETGSGASDGYAGDWVSPALKKPRLHRERRPGDHERGDGSRFERHKSTPDAAGTTGVAKGAILGPPRKVSSQAPSEAASPQEAAVAARNAAIAAAKVAAAAKANAAAKASASVKAAAAAKLALEAAAHASKAEAACRAELRRKLGNSETKTHGALRLEINVHSEPRRERSSKGELKYERDEVYAGRRSGGTGSVDDEELARQLHRAMNSSPRISRSMAPMRRKQSVKPETPSSGVSNSSAETVRARPRTSAPSPAEPAQEHAQIRHEHEQPPHLFRHQQTRPRSITHKEFRRIESRVSRHEVKMAEEGTGQEGECVRGLEPSRQEAAVLSHMASQPAEDLASSVKSEAMEGVMFPAVGAHDEASILFDALVEADGEDMDAAGNSGGIHDRRPDYLQEILEAAVLSDAAMFNDASHAEVSDLETVRSEPARPEPLAAEQGEEAAETSGLQVEESVGGPNGADGEAGDAMAVETSEPMAVEATENMACEPMDAVAGEATHSMAGKPIDAVAGVASDAMAGEATDAVAGEASTATAGDAPDAEAQKAGDDDLAIARETTTLGQDEENGSTVLHDVEMQEVGDVDSAPAGREDGMLEQPSSTSKTRVEERSGGETPEETRDDGEAGAEEMRNKAVPNASILGAVARAEAPSTVSEERKSSASESEAEAASEVTACQQSG